MATRTAGISESLSGVEATQPSVKRCWGAFLLAAIEAVCVFYVSAAKLGLAVAAATIATSGWATVLHRDVFRIPMLALASLAAACNLFLVWRARSLMNAPAAAWRRRTPTLRERWRTRTVVAVSLLTLLLAAAEVVIHHLHQSKPMNLSQAARAPSGGVHAVWR
ncbi:MAG TPA: hypothetical protein VKH81_22160 [Candidatus Angelobacter sp.]|nr:hypothetical protein [Candidatus Angelobacter sp.]